MLDFFEQIAPKVGVTAEAFEQLSGPDALQLYVSSLEKANLSQEQMTFYMEALASDSTMLLPLIRNNAAGMNEFALATQHAMRPEVLKSLTDITTGLVTLGTTIRNLVFNAFGPLIKALSDSIRGWQKLITDFPTVVKWVGLITSAVVALTVAMYANPIGMIVAGFAALVTAAGWVYDKLAMIKDATGSWATAFDLMSKAAGFAFGTVVAYGESLRINLALAFNDIKNDWVDLVGGMKITFAEMVDGFADSGLGSMMGITGGKEDAARLAHADAVAKVTDEFIVLMDKQSDIRARLDTENPSLARLTEVLTPAIEENTAAITKASSGVFAAGSKGVVVPKAGDKGKDTGPDAMNTFMSSFQSRLSDAFKSGDFKGFLKGVLDDFTGGIIDGFTQSITKSLFKNLDFGDLFSGFGGGGGGGGGWLSSAFGAASSFFGAADGGIVPTTPFSKSYADSVPTMLQPGELVVPKSQVDNFMGGGSTGGQTFNITVTGDVSRQTRSEIVKMMPQIAAGTNMVNRENNSR